MLVDRYIGIIPFQRSRMGGHMQAWRWHPCPCGFREDSSGAVPSPPTCLALCCPAAARAAALRPSVSRKACLRYLQYEPLFTKPANIDKYHGCMPLSILAFSFYTLCDGVGGLVLSHAVHSLPAMAWKHVHDSGNGIHLWPQGHSQDATRQFLT